MMRRFLTLIVALSLVAQAAPSMVPAAGVSRRAVGVVTSEAMSLPLFSSRYSMLSVKPVISYLDSLRTAAKFSGKDALFTTALLGILVGGLHLDFRYVDGWALRHPEFILVSFLPVSTVTAFVADLAAQWLEMKLKAPHEFYVRRLSLGRAWNLILTGAVYSVTVESLIYVSGLHSLPFPFVPPAMLPLVRALFDILLISPWITDPLAYFVYANYIEGGGEREAVAQIRENGARVYAMASPFWFLAMWLSMSSNDPTLRFIWVSIGVVLWNLIFSIEAGEKNIPLPRLVRYALRPVQYYFGRPWFGWTMRWELKFFATLVVMKQLVLFHIHPEKAAVFSVALVAFAHLLPRRMLSMGWRPLGASA